jgi:uncharacterized protein (TIGR02996 family)
MNRSKTRGFLEDIVAHPDDDAPRLIFADWLEDQGDSARAEFIRVQIERTSLTEWDARQVLLRLREGALLEEHGQKWKAELANLKEVSWGEFRRGFVATAIFSTFAALGENASACWAAAPIEAIEVPWPRRREPKGCFAPIAGLREVSIHASCVDHSEVSRLADAPLLSTLRVLNINRCGLGTEGFRRLIASPHLGNLTALRVPENTTGNGGVSALFDAVSLTAVEELDLSEADAYGRYGEDPIIDSGGLEALATWPGMTRVRSLTLSGNYVGQEGLRALLRSPHTIGLKELVLRGSGLTGEAMQEFDDARPELQLDVLDLGENLLRDLGAMDLATAPCLRELKVLELDRCELPLSAARRLAKAKFLGSLRRLNVDSNSFGPEGLHALLEKKPNELHTLQMVDNDLGDKGVSLLAKSPASNKLLEVNLAENGLGDRAAKALSTSEQLRNLLILRLGYTLISRPAAEALAGSPLGKRLAVLELDEVPTDDELQGDGDMPF